MDERPLSGVSLHDILSSYWDTGQLSNEYGASSKEEKINDLVQALMDEFVSPREIKVEDLSLFFSEKGFVLDIDKRESKSLINLINAHSSQSPVFGGNKITKTSLSLSVKTELTPLLLKYSVDPETPSMKKLDRYMPVTMDESKKEKPLTKMRKKSWHKLPNVKVGPLKLNNFKTSIKELHESIFGTQGELAGRDASKLENNFRNRLSRLRDVQHKLKMDEKETLISELDEIKKKILKEDKKGSEKDQNLIDQMQLQIDSLNQTVDSIINESRLAYSQFNQRIDPLIDKSKRTKIVIEELKQLASLGGNEFILFLPMLNRDVPGRIHGMCFGAENQEFNSDQKTVVIMTGSCDRAENFAYPMVEDFRKKGYQSVIFNYMGFGDSDGEMNEWGLFASAEAVIQFLTASEDLVIPEKNLILYGYSLGGYVAAEIALNHLDISKVIFDRTYTSGLDVAEKEYGRLGKLARQFMNDNFGALNTANKILNFNPKMEVAIFDAENELEEKAPNFGQKSSKGEWSLKEQFHESVKPKNYHVIKGKGHYHPSTGIWFSEDNPETVPEARKALYEFLGPSNPAEETRLKFDGS